jgi:hypothetical protein
MKINLPTSLKKYFWGDNLNDLKWPDHKKYIIQTLLEKGNGRAIRWLFNLTSKSQIIQLLPEFRLSKKSLNFWETYLS